MVTSVPNTLPTGLAHWQPAFPSIIADEGLAQEVAREGFARRPFLSSEQLTQLREIYNDAHKLQNGEGAMFYTLYSQDLAYRQRMDAQVGAVLKPVLDSWFQHYKTVLHGFIVKVPGPKSGFLIHQDTTGLDEFKYTSLSVWIPLWDIGPDNGAMCLVPRSHKMGYPYRGISFAFPFDKIHGTVKRYLQPIFMQAGEAIIFDQRTFHASLPNRSGQNRVVAIAGLFPEEAQFQICYQESPAAPIELYAQEDDFILKYPRFMHDCRTRPIEGVKTGEVHFQVPLWTADEFVAKAEAAGLAPLDLLSADDRLGCNPMPEPDGVQREPLAPVIPLAPALDTEMSAPSTPENQTSQKTSWFQRIFGK